MELRPGYKRTEVGVIPEEWEVEPLATLTTGVSSGKSKPIKGATNFPVFGSTGIIGHTDKPAYEGKAILVARVGANAGTLNVVTGQYGVTDNTIILSTSESALPDFLWRVLQTKRLNRLVFGSGQPLITGTQLKALSIQLPSLDEQRAIATALSDVDALLTQLDRLIAKKRDIKQAAMQQLLTGKKRLPGFEGEWLSQRLGDIAPLQRGFDLPARQIHWGPYPVIFSNGVLKHHHRFMVRGPGVVTGRSGTIGNVHFIEADFWPHNTSLWVTNFHGNSPRFIFYLYRFIGLENFASGSGVPTLNRNDVHAHHVRMPASIEEQAAIATIFSDMDAELATLEARRDKTRALKQGMMQELLTGRTRLV